MPTKKFTQIRGHELLVSHLGYWPTFEDFEVISMNLERAPWTEAASRDLRATFSGFDINKSQTDPERKPSLIEIQFEEISNLQISGFNHQNPITGLTINQQGDGEFEIRWGGSALKHDVSFTCKQISVLRVIDLNPFRKSLAR